VSVVGSWSKWLERHEATWNPKEGVFEAWVALPVAQHEFKFVVNEHWVTCDDYDAATNELGKNNVISVTKPDVKTQTQEKKFENPISAIKKEWVAPWQSKAEAYTTTADEIKALKREKKTMTNVITELRKELDKAKVDVEARENDTGKLKMQLRALETEARDQKQAMEDKLRESNQALQDAAVQLKAAASAQQQNDPPYQAALEKVAELTADLKESRAQVDKLSKQVEELLAASATARRLGSIGTGGAVAAAAEAAAAAAAATAARQAAEKEAEAASKTASAAAVAAAQVAKREAEAAKNAAQAAKQAEKQAVVEAQKETRSAAAAVAAADAAAPTQCGVGMTLEAPSKESNDCCVVRGLKKGGPIDLTGSVKVGDRLLAVGDVSCVGMSREKIKDYVVGPAGSAVRLKFQRVVEGAEPLVIEVAEGGRRERERGGRERERRKYLTNKL